MNKRNRIWTILIGIFLTLGLLILINFIPTFNLKSDDMSLLQGKWIDVYYEKEASAAKDVFDFADAGTAEIAAKLGFKEKQDVHVFIYDN